MLAKALNTYLGLDPESQKRLHTLRDKVVTVELTPLHIIFQCEFTADGIRLHSGDALTAEAKIKGTPMQMLGAMIAKNQRHRFFADDLTIEGNADLGLQLVDLFDALDIDWEEYFSRVAGDTPAYHVGRFARGIKKWFKQTEQSFTQNVSEYLQEEKQWLPSREALHDFFLNIDEARMDTDRLEAKIKQLQNHIAADDVVASKRSAQ